MISARAWWCFVGCLSLAVGTPSHAIQENVAREKRPNVVFIIADDLGSWALGTYGVAKARTPNLDRLGSQGIVFLSAFAASAVCSPARAALYTGRYPSETGIVDNGRDESSAGLPAGIPTWQGYLQRAGYRTGLIGKWGLGSDDDADLPTRHGFDDFIGFRNGGRVSKEPRIEIIEKSQDHHSKSRVIDHDEIPGDVYTSDLLADEAARYIRQRNHPDTPFALCLAFWAPHANTDFPRGFQPPYQDRSWLPLKAEDLGPWERAPESELTVPEPHFPNLDQPRLHRIIREYNASVHSVDRGVGRVLAALDDPNGDGDMSDSIAANTIVVFTSDQGFMMGHHGMWHKGNGRWITRSKQDPTPGLPYGNGESRPNLFEVVTRVPFIVRWPNQIKAGQRLGMTISHLDWLPTVTTLARAQLPGEAGARGRDLSSVLLGGATPEGMDTYFAQYRDLRAYRTSQWKLVRHHGPANRDEFYDLTSDPNESSNLIADPSPRVAAALGEMERTLRKRMTEVADPLMKRLNQ